MRDLTAEEKLKKVHDELVWLSRELQPEPVLSEEDGEELYDLCRRVLALSEKTGRSIHVIGTQYNSYGGKKQYGGSVTVFYENSAKENGYGCVQESIYNAHKAIREAQDLERAALASAPAAD